MKRKKMELNKKLFLNKKSIAALNSSEMSTVQGGLPKSFIKYGCPQSYECRGGGSGGVTCESAGDICPSGLAEQC